jgi:uncharacterized protein YjbI with pentapeptide repeats
MQNLLDSGNGCFRRREMGGQYPFPRRHDACSPYQPDLDLKGTHMRSIIPGLLLFIALAACGGAEAPELAHSSRSDAVVASNGRRLNGRRLNGRRLNGQSLNGLSLDAVSFSGSELDRKPLTGLQLNGSQLVGVAHNSQSVAGTQFSGASLAGVLSDGSTLPLRIDNVSTGTGSDSDIWFYDVSYQSDEGWLPLCDTDSSGAPLSAIALAGTWDYSEGTNTGGSWTPSSTTFTFGCRMTAVAKCVEAGYKPWASYQGESLRNYHQACTRLIRADYCGNGRSWTLDGRMINVYDALGVQKDTERWTFEAEWTGSGARCLSGMRVIDLKNVFGVVDQCVLNKALNLGCGSPWHFATGTLLMDEYRDQNLLGIINL